MTKLFLNISLCWLLFFGCTKNSANRNIAQYLPLDSEIENWRPADTVKTYVGEDLFMLINGGAEIYFKNGFTQIVSQAFENSNGKQIVVELYEMNSIDGSRSIYESKISDDGTKLAIGDAATLNNYYLNLYKMNYQLTLVGFDDDQETKDGLKYFAEIISGKIK